MADTNTYQAQANELSQKLWAIANELRGQMDASEFKNYILGYNLNIPRYVDTFEEEEPVDLDAVKAQIKTLDSETKAAIDKAESFMRQLGL